MSSSIDIGGMVMGTAEMMGGNLTNLGDDILNKRQTDKANEWNLGLWNLQNQYNDPSAQMARLRNAGLNPNLMYSQGNTGNAGTTPSYVKPTFKGASFDGMLSKYTQVRQNELLPYQKDLVQANISDKNITIDNKIIEGQNKITQGLLMSQNLKDKKLQYDINSTLKQNSIDLEKERLRTVLSNNYILNQTQGTIIDKRKQELVNMQENALNLQQQRKNMEASIQMAVQNIAESKSRVDLNTINQRILQATEQLKNGEITLQNWEIQLSNMGVTKNDKYLIRLASGIDQKVTNAMWQFDKDVQKIFNRNKKNGAGGSW